MASDDRKLRAGGKGVLADCRHARRNVNALEIIAAVKRRVPDGEQVVGQETTNKEVEEYAKAYSEMKPKQAAAIFDTMTNNLSLVARILDAMSATSRGNILGAMDPEIAASVTAIMNPK